jgi:hypothetical protein
MRGAVIAFVVVVCVLICALTGRQIWDARAADMRVAGQQTANLSRSLSQQVADGLQTIDAVLVDTSERVEATGTGPAQRPAFAGSSGHRFARCRSFTTSSSSRPAATDSSTRCRS